MVKVNHVFLVPWIILSLPQAVFFQQQLPIGATLSVLGLAGMVTKNRTAAGLTSASLLGLIVWEKVSSDLYHLSGLDSALLLFDFMLVIFLMEASDTTISFDRASLPLKGKNDDISTSYRLELILWARNQLLSIGRLIAAAFGLSLSLLVMGDLVSISVNQIAFSGILVMVAVVALLILVTYGREPEDRDRRRN